MSPILIKIFYILLFTISAQAEDFSLEEKPMYEFGMGGGGGYFTDYPGSNQNHFRGVPFPYFIYRGPIFHSDQRRGTRARFLHAKSYELALSGSGSFPASSQQNNARVGMPNLDWIAEIGPRLILELSEPEEVWQKSISLPLRYVFSTDLSKVEHQGYSFTPTFTLERFGLLHKDSRLAFDLTFNFMDQMLSRYFFEVPARYANATRPEYSARAGYLGAELNIKFSHPIKNYLRTFTGFGINNYHESVNDNSPLLKAKWSYDFTVGLIWVFLKSDRKAVEY